MKYTELHREYLKKDYQFSDTFIMEKISIIIEKPKDYFDGYSENGEGIYGAGDSINKNESHFNSTYSLY